jgi:hypothetical protein
MKLGKGSCHGTFGELVQGIIGERPFLITLPIPSLRSEAIFIPDPAISEIRVVNGQLMERFGVLPQCHQDKFQKINKCYFPYTTRSLCWWIKTNRF